MQTIEDTQQLRTLLNVWKRQGESIAFVPTMGNLHAGHMQLVNTARQRAQRVVVSIFVNPTQFGVGEDFENYPRTEQQDADQLVTAEVDVLFLPSVAMMYPGRAQVSLQIAELGDDYCGRVRPGHFSGVATVVCKLFNIVQPDLAFFGEKDFQQLAIIRKMVQDLNVPLEIFGVPTVRENDGLAMSSRNAYLTQPQRQLAPQLYQNLLELRDKIRAGARDYKVLTERTFQQLVQAGFAPDYVEIARADDLQPATSSDTQLVILIAAKLGSTRLIDNLSVNLNTPI